MKKRYIFLIFLVVLVATALILINTQLDSFIKEKLIREVRIETDSTYNMTIGSLDVSFFPVKISMEDIAIASEDSTYIFLDSTSSVYADITIDKAVIYNFSWQSYLFDDELEGSLTLEDPDLKILRRKEPGANLYSKTVDSRKKLFIEMLKIQDAKIDYRDNKEHLNTNLSASLTDITNNSRSSELLASLDLQLQKLDYTDPSGLYGVTCDSINFDGGETLLNLNKLEFRTLTGRQEISEIMGYQQSWYDFNVPSVMVEGDGKTFWSDNGLLISQVSINQPEINVYSDGRYSREGMPHKDMPDEMISQIPFPLLLQKLKIKNGFISYETHSKKTDQLGRLTFSAVNIEADSFSNKLPDRPLTITASALLMEKGKVDVDIKIPQSKNSYPYRVEGHIAPMDMTEINPIYQPVSNCKIKSGKSDDSYFTFIHDEKSSNGNMRFYYEDLKVELPDKNDDGFFQKIGNSLKTAVANTFVVNSDSDQEEGKTGDIKAKRDKSQFVLGYWWKSLLSGFMDTMK